jgi:superfamily II DNA or RNA helicase
LFINSAVVNFGINLEFIDVILFLNKFRNQSEKEQMIGRAQRRGRNPNTPLEIVYLNPR